MKKRMRLKKTHPISSWQKIIYCFIFSLLLALLFLFWMSKNLSPALQNYATLESKQFAKNILNDALEDVSKNQSFQENLYTLYKNKNEEITTIDFDTTMANEVLSNITNQVSKKLLALENGNVKNLPVNQSFQGTHFKKYKNGVVCEIPLGLVTNHFFLANLGYVIPVRFSFIGMMDASIKSKITPYGINNALVELYILVELNEKITMPIASNEVKVSIEIPFVTQMINGKVPTYYQGSLTGSSNILSVPLESNEVSSKSDGSSER